MNILITGSSRGIGAAAHDLLKSTGHDVVGHSTRGGGELIAGDLTDPDAPRVDELERPQALRAQEHVASRGCAARQG